MKKFKKLHKNNKALLSLLVIVIVLGAIVFTAKNQNGKAVVEIIVSESGTTVFLNDARKTQTRTDNQTVTLRLAPGEHRILLGANERFPYLKNVTVKAGDMLILEPFTYPQAGELTEVENEEIKAEIKSQTMPGRFTPLLSDSENQTIWIEGNSVLIDWVGAENERPDYICTGTECGGGTFVYGSEDTITYAEFFPGRDDRVLLRFNNTVHVVEIDRIGNQNIQPVYQGKNFSFTSNNNTLYVLDKTEDALFQISL